jgi:hypothetical protein
MCIFASAVAKVARTRILVAPTRDNRQLTVYENVVTSTPGAATNAMILPCPSYGGKVELLDLSRDGFTFGRLEACYPTFTPHASRSMAKGLFVGVESNSAPLEVHQVGAYKVSVAPTLHDVARANRRVFTLAPNVQALFERRYSTGFAFVICAFDAGRGIEPHPVAYVHDRPGSGSRLFVPCVHEHGHARQVGVDGKEHFDHDVYSLCCTRSAISEDVRACGETPPEALLRLMARIERGRVHPPTIDVAFALRGSEALYPLLPAGHLTLRRAILEGMYPNLDVLLDLESTEQTMRTRELDSAYAINARQIQTEYDERVSREKELYMREDKARRVEERANEAVFSHRK